MFSCHRSTVRAVQIHKFIKFEVNVANEGHQVNGHVNFSPTVYSREIIFFPLMEIILRKEFHLFLHTATRDSVMTSGVKGISAQVSKTY